MDWNWFFSSLSQSSAAIVGIFGAFIITKVLSNQAAFQEKLGRFKSLETSAARLVESADNLHFRWYIRLTTGRALSDAEDLLDKDEALKPESLYEELNFSSFLARHEALTELQALKERREQARQAEVERLQEIARQQQQFLRKPAGRLGAFPGIGSVAGAMAIPVPQKFPPLGALNHPYAELQKELEAINALEVEIRHHMRTVTDFLATVSPNPESSRAISAALLMVAALFLLGVVYPLSFMPTPAVWTPELELQGFWSRVFSLRGGLLIVVSSIFTAALAMFAFMNKRMRYPAEQISALEKFTDIATYSEFYAVAQQNRSVTRA
jgi:hypothetical protein